MTLTQWGEQVFPLREGKHPGKTFQTVLTTDPKYATMMKNHIHLTSPWAKSFQNYVRAMDAQKVNPSPMPKAKMPPKQTAESSHSWERVDQGPIVKKRTAVETEEEEPMESERDFAREQQLMAQIAILQRELDLARQP